MHDAEHVWSAQQWQALGLSESFMSRVTVSVASRCWAWSISVIATPGPSQASLIANALPIGTNTNMHASTVPSSLYAVGGICKV